jgi:putative ABC transport system permease protein
MKTLYRRYKRTKWTLFVTISGFAVGLTAALLLLIFIQHELSYDRHWQDANRIFRVNTTIVENNRTVEFPICIRKAYTELPAKIPGIKAAVQIYRTINPEIKIDDKRFRNLKIWYVDSTFFKVFAVPAIAGDVKRALSSPDAIVINKKTADKLFGNSNSVGKAITAIDLNLPPQGQLFHVSAVVQNLPATSHFDFDVLLPMSANITLERLRGLEFYTYYRLEKEAAINVTTTQIEQEYNSMMSEWIKSINASLTPKGKLLPIKQIYLYSQANQEIGPQGDLKIIQIFAILTILILGVAIANFINLFLLQGTKRALETGIRKTVGASRIGLILQFMKDSFFITGLAFLIAIYLAFLLLGPLGDIIRRPLNTGFLFQSELVIGMIGLFILIVLLAGVYPAWYLSKFQPIQVLKGSGLVKNPKNRLRKSMVVLQFAICMILLTNLIMLQKQFNFMNNQPLGFDAKNIVAFENLSPQMQKSYQLIKNDLQQLPGIALVTGSHSFPGRGASGQSIKVYGSSNDSRITFREVRVQPDYFQTYGIHLQSGRGFEANRPADRNAVVLNETAARALELKEPIGAQVIMFKEPMEVIGVIKDYHYASLRDPVKPEVFTYYKDQILAISIRLSTSQNIIEQIIKVLRKYDSDYTPDYVFLQETFEAMYGGEQQLIQLVRTGSLLALALTLLGLASITAITVKQRTKEIGIRKTIGATTNEIVVVLIGSQIKVLVYVTFLSGLAAWWIIHSWLQNYAYRTNVDIWIFLLAGFIVLTVASFTTAVISYQASRKNLIESLRYE